MYSLNADPGSKAHVPDERMGPVVDHFRTAGSRSGGHLPVPRDPDTHPYPDAVRDFIERLNADALTDGGPAPYRLTGWQELLLTADRSALREALRGGRIRPEDAYTVRPG